MREQPIQVGALREFASDEFIANSASGPNATWANGFNHGLWFSNGKPVAPGRLQLTGLNRQLTRRRVYAYAWCSAPNSQPVQIMLDCRINFYLGQKALLVIPLTYTIGYNLFSVSTALGITQSKFTAPVTGGVAALNSIGLSLLQANATAINPEPANSILMQPYEVDFQCDKITLDVCGGLSANLNDSRFILLSCAP